MDWIPEAIEKTGEAFGLTEFILFTVAALVGLAIWASVKKGDPVSANPVADVVPLVVCGAGELKAVLHELNMGHRVALERQGDIKSDVHQMTQTLPRIEQQLGVLLERTRKTP